MRIVLVPSSFAPHVGGIEEVTRQLAKQLLAAGDDVEVWTHRHPTSLPDSETVEGVPVRRFAFPLPAARLGSLARWPVVSADAQAKLLRAMRRFRPEVVHVHGFSGNGIHASLSSGLAGVPLVVTLHGETSMDDHDIFDRSVTLRAGLRLAFRRAAAVTAPSQFILDDAGRFGLPRDRARIIPNGVDLREELPGNALVTPFDRFVLALGRMVPNKGFDLLLEAFSMLAADRPGLGLVIGGAGPQRGEVEARARALGLMDRVLLAGLLDRGQVSSMMSRATVFALPSRLEPFGVVVLEAMRAGTPVVATSRGGVKGWARDGVDLLIADPEDPATFAEAVGHVLDDRRLAGSLGAAGRRLVVEFDWPVIGRRYRDLYSEVIDGGSP